MGGVGKLGMRKRLRVKHIYAFFPCPPPPSCSNSVAWTLNGAMQLRNYMNVWEGEACAASLAAFD